MRRGSGEKGFSLVELMVALAVTLIVSTAIFKLVGSGETSMRREPELSYRQQNIRFGMATISTDIYSAGSAMPMFAQTFTDKLDGVGPLLGPTGVNTDQLEIFTSAECPSLSICDFQPGSSVTTWDPLSSCYNFPTLVMLANETEWGVFWAEEPGAGRNGSCPGGGGPATNGHTTFPKGQAPLVNPPGGKFGLTPTVMTVISVARYKIDNESDGVPGLWRSAYGGQNLPDGTSSWQLVARGVEDLQVRYQNGSGWNDTPGTVTDVGTVVRNVEVRLSARVTAQNLAGESKSAVGNAIRGQLVSQVVPRTALVVLQVGEQWR